MTQPNRTPDEQEHAKKARSEQEVFDELAALCASPGYAHVIAYFCLRDQVVGYGDELRPEDFARLFSLDRLIRTEISTLIGLMLRGPRALDVPDPNQFEVYIKQTEALLNELHAALNQPMVVGLQAAMEGTKTPDPFERAEAMREPIFYGAESAFGFQYRDFAVEKYARDGEWLQKHKGFSPDEASQVAAVILEFLDRKLLATVKSLKDVPPERWTVLDGFKFTLDEVASEAGLPIEIVEAVVSAFSFPENGNPTFTSLNEFNFANAYPIIRSEGDSHILFLGMSLLEALYETPFYWMGADNAYEATAMKNRGLFTEEFTADRLKQVFGPDNVFCNVDIWETKARKKRLGEIDTLVLFGGRAIIVQAKSKKLTLESRKGNDLQLQADFKAAVQDSCDQALLCSELLLRGNAFVTDSMGKELPIPYPIKHIHPLCVVSDHYPALSFQAQQFLKYPAADAVSAPLVCDIFFIDVVTEFWKRHSVA